MKKKKFNKISGLTLVEVLISIAVSSIMMAAMFTSYNLINKSYNQVMDRATISQASRDFMGMMVKDVRMAGYKAFGDNITADISHMPIQILKSQRFGNANGCCDEIFIVHGDYNYEASPEDRFERYRAHYYVDPSEIIDPKTNERIPTGALYKSFHKWNGVNFTANDCDDCYSNQLLTNFIEDFVVVAIDENGIIIDPPPSEAFDDEAYDIKVVDILVTFRSKEEFFKTKKERIVTAIGKNSENRKLAKNDKYFRDSVVMTVHTRNIGIEQ